MEICSGPNPKFTSKALMSNTNKEQVTAFVEWSLGATISQSYKSTLCPLYGTCTLPNIGGGDLSSALFLEDAQHAARDAIPAKRKRP